MTPTDSMNAISATVQLPVWTRCWRIGSGLDGVQVALQTQLCMCVCVWGGGGGSKHLCVNVYILTSNRQPLWQRRKFTCDMKVFWTGGATTIVSSHITPLNRLGGQKLGCTSWNWVVLPWTNRLNNTAMARHSMSAEAGTSPEQLTAVTQLL